MIRFWRGARSRFREKMLVEMRKRDIPVVIGADAHVPERVGDQYEQALDLLELSGYTHVSYFLDRSRREISIEAARLSLVGVEAS